MFYSIHNAKVGLNSIKGLKRYRANKKVDGRTDGQHENIMSPTTGGGGIKILLWLKFNKSGGLSSEGHYSVNVII